MTFRDARALFKFWDEAPPENEMLAVFAQAMTTWKPASARISSAEDHQRSLEERWKSGAMNAKQLVEALGGAKGIAVRMDGTIQATRGIESFPGAL